MVGPVVPGVTPGADGRQPAAGALHHYPVGSAPDQLISLHDGVDIDGDTAILGGQMRRGRRAGRQHGIHQFVGQRRRCRRPAGPGRPRCASRRAVIDHAPAATGFMPAALQTCLRQCLQQLRTRPRSCPRRYPCRRRTGSGAAAGCSRRRRHQRRLARLPRRLSDVDAHFTGGIGRRACARVRVPRPRRRPPARSRATRLAGALHS